VTLLLATFDAETGRLAYVRAGHIPPFLRRASGAMERLAVLGGPPIGLIEDIAHKSASVHLAPGDQILIVTDGITEAADPAGAMFGEARLGAFFAGVRPGEADALRRLTAVVRSFEAGAPPADDVAAVLLAVYGGAVEIRLEPE
jgi:sigma-B regulation protein RsbU (phosphoserine phosphatase)